MLLGDSQFRQTTKQIKCHMDGENSLVGFCFVIVGCNSERKNTENYMYN